MPTVGVVGGGIVGLALARQLADSIADARVTVFEKEDAVGLHQTTRNSGVVHAGVYYQPGSLKATLCRHGSVLLRAFCEQERLPFDAIGKLVVACDDTERARLGEIERRARANGVPDLERLDRAGLRALEPAVEGVSALYSPSTAITDFSAIARRMAENLQRAGHSIRLGRRVTRVSTGPDGGTVEVGGARTTFDRVVVCAGLGTDALLAGSGDAFGREPLGVPFRGEYFRLTGSSKNLVSHLVYPVPDPRYPFLGVHFTPRVDGEVLIGPNAVLAGRMEGYRAREFSIADLRRLASFPGFWRMAAANWRTGLHELAGSISRHTYLERARRYVPELREDEVERAPAGVRAQAISRRGEFVDDIVLQVSGSVSIVRNAPSPAATSSLAIAAYVVDQLAF